MTHFGKQLTGPLIFTFFGLLFFAIGLGMTLRQRTLEKQGIEAQGVVIGLHENYDNDGGTYAPVVQFNTVSGLSVEFVSSYYSSPPAYEIGEAVTVVYPPERPKSAVIKGDGQLLHTIFMLIGGIAAALGSYFMFSTLRNMAFIQPEE